MLNVLEATNENFHEPILKDHVCKPQTQIPNKLIKILESRCPPQFRMACKGEGAAAHVVIRYRS
jgi:hypothetical protein